MLQEVVFQCMPLFLVGLYYHSIQRWRHLASTVCCILYLPNGLQTPNNYSHIFINNTHHTKSTFLLHMWHLISPRPGLAFMSLGTIVLNVGEPPRSYHCTTYIIMPSTIQLFYLAESLISCYMLQYCTHIYSKGNTYFITYTCNKMLAANPFVGARRKMFPFEGLDLLSPPWRSLRKPMKGYGYTSPLPIGTTNGYTTCGHDIWQSFGD